MLGGCLRTIGCGTLLVVGVGVAWLTRDRWWPQLRDGRDSAVVVEASGNSLSDSGAQRAENSIRSLGQATGPAYVNITPEDLAALIVREAGRTPLPLKDATAGVVGDRLWLRGTLDLRQLRAQGALGTIGVLLGDEEEVELRGTLDIVQPGLAQFRVTAFKVSRYLSSFGSHSATHRPDLPRRTATGRERERRPVPRSAIYRRRAHRERPHHPLQDGRRSSLKSAALTQTSDLRPVVIA